MSQINSYNPLLASSLNSLWTVPQESESSTNAETSKSSSVQNNSQSRANQAYGIARINQLTAAAQAAFEGLGLTSNNRVTFGNIEAYTKQEQEKFAENVKKGLEEAGVSTDAEYQIVTKYEDEGIEIVTDSPDKLKIEQFFRDNPELVDKFKELQYLGNLEKSLSQENIAANMAMTKIQIQSMSSLFTSNPSSSIMSSASDGSYFGMGLSTIV